MVEIASPELEKIETPKKSSKKPVIVIFIIIVLIAVIAIGAYKMTGNTIKSNPIVLIETTQGNIKIELYPDKAPITVKNFLSYVKDGTYENTVFHRVIKNFMIQGGGYTETGEQKPTKPPIKLESDNGLKNELGTIAMARTTVPDSATDQFFINTGDNFFLDKGNRDEGYAVFGKVIEGMDVVNNIQASKTTVKYGMGDWPETDVVIKKMTLLN